MMREYTCIYHLFNQDTQKRKKGLSEYIKELLKKIGKTYNRIIIS
jgi:hypothetical protein